MMRLSSASGTSSVSQDLIPVMRTFTTLPQGQSSNGVDYDTYHPFRPILSYLEADGPVNININGQGDVPLKDDGTGVYKLNFEVEKGMITPRTLTVDAVVNWECTFLF